MYIKLNLENNRYKGYIKVTTDVDTVGLSDADISTLNTTTHIVLKRRRENYNQWVSVKCWERTPQSTVSGGKLNGFKFEYNDYSCRNKYTYEYMVEYVVVSGGKYSKTIATTIDYVESIYDCYVIYDYEKSYFTPLNVGAITINTQRPFAMNAPMTTRKPSLYYNCITKYDEGSCTGIFLDIAGTDTNFDFVKEHNWEYRHQFKDWLTNGNSKIIKDMAGQRWVVGIKTDSISDGSLFD